MDHTGYIDVFRTSSHIVKAGRRAATVAGRSRTFCKLRERARESKDAFESLIPFETLILGVKWRERDLFFGLNDVLSASFVCLLS